MSYSQINTVVKLFCFRIMILHEVLYPIALRKAKIVCSFGLSECSRVKLKLSTISNRLKWRAWPRGLNGLPFMQHVVSLTPTDSTYQINFFNPVDRKSALCRKKRDRVVISDCSVNDCSGCPPHQPGKIVHMHEKFNMQRQCVCYVLVPGSGHA